jgi:hypothetical protein
MQFCPTPASPRRVRRVLPILLSIAAKTAPLASLSNTIVLAKDGALDRRNAR